MMITLMLLDGLRRFIEKVTPSPPANDSRGLTVSSICLKINDEIVRGIASPDPTPTIKAKA